MVAAVVITAVVTVLVTVLAMLLVLNARSAEESIAHSIDEPAEVDSEQFRRVMGSLLGPPIVGGNRVRALKNGDAIFASMLEAIRGAERTIAFETFIYWSGEIAREFAAALAERASSGVRVKVLLDAIGAGPMDRSLIGRMEAAGVDVELYHPPALKHLARLNHRTHRKLLIVDGRVGFTGGVGIADEWRGDARGPEEWRDTHFRVEGPVVAHLQSAFMDNWLKTHSEVLHQEDWFARLDPVGDVAAQLFKSGPREGSASVRLMYALSLAAARESVLMSTAYFVPDRNSQRRLERMARAGIRIEIIVPGRLIDKRVVRRASRSSWGGMLRAGVKIYEYQPSMYHTKVLVIDGKFVSVGSTNFDNRSFKQNDEANLNVLDGGLARLLGEQFEEDKARSREVTLEYWERRPWNVKLKDRAATLLHGQL